VDLKGHIVLLVMHVSIDRGGGGGNDKTTAQVDYKCHSSRISIVVDKTAKFNSAASLGLP
jgi:hypothetical protein